MRIAKGFGILLPRRSHNDDCFAAVYAQFIHFLEWNAAAISVPGKLDHDGVLIYWLIVSSFNNYRVTMREIPVCYVY